MAAHLPEIVIAFKKAAATFNARATRGVCFLIVREANPDTESEDPLTPYVTEVTESTVLTGWSETNQQYIKDILAVNPYKFYVVTIDTAGAISTGTALIEKTYPTGRVTMVGESADYTALVTWAKAKKTYHVLTFATSGSNSRYVENLASQSVVFDDDDHGTGAQSSVKLLPTLAALLCRANATQGMTYAVISALKSVEGIGDTTAENAAINQGNLILKMDWSGETQVVRLGTAVNTLTTFTDDEPEDFRYIEVSESADMIRDDISAIFKENYIGKRKNTYENQLLLLSNIGQYYDELESVGILNADGDNVVTIDTVAQRAAWITTKPEAAEWDDDMVRVHPYGRKVFLTSAVQILESMQDLTLNIELA